MKQQAAQCWGLCVSGAALLLGCAGYPSVDVSPTGSDNSGHGQIELALGPVSGVTLDSVHYTVSSSSTPPAVIAEGELPTPGSSKDFTAGLSMPVGNGYSISLSAASAESGDDITCGGSFGPFAVAPDTSQPIRVVLSCHDNTNGSAFAAVQVSTDACPRLVFDYLMATPRVSYVGFRPVTLLGKAHDLDGKAITYSWSGGVIFTPVMGQSSSATCNSGGARELTLTVSNGECSRSLRTTIECRFDDLCGNGVVDPGENCDTGLPDPSPSDCTCVCGDGVTEAPAETCDPGNTATCDTTCHLRHFECNDGFLTPPEPCDPSANPSVPAGTPSSLVCKPDCTLAAH